MKVVRAVIILLAFLAFNLLAEKASAIEPMVRYVTTVNPLTLILREITVGRAEIDCLLPPNSSPHTFEPTPSDLKILESAHAFFYGGPGLDSEWIKNLPFRRKVAMISMVPEKERLQMVQDHDHDHGHGHGEKGTIDPHFWTDPLTVKAMVPQLVAELGEIDPAGKAIYVANGELFKQKLDQLDLELRKILKPIADEPLLLFHPSFNYLFHRYNLNSAGVVVESPGREPSPRFLYMLVKKIKEKKIKALFTEPQLAKRPAKVLAESADIPVYELDPIGGVAGRQSYYELLIYNSNTLSKAFR